VAWRRHPVRLGSASIFDGTLAHYEGWQSATHIGPPVPAMLARVKGWLEHGHPKYGEVAVKLVTARVSVLGQRDEFMDAWMEWCATHGLPALDVTNSKDYGMVELWDDRAVQVEANTGRRMDGQPEPEGPA
jgi:hypothetical protein